MAANQQQAAPTTAKTVQKSEDGTSNEASSPTSSEHALADNPASSAPATSALTVNAPLSALPSHISMSRPGSAQSMNPPITTLNGIPISIKDVKDPGQFGTTGSNAGGSILGSTVWNPAIGRDAKGRAKSRDYLKQSVWVSSAQFAADKNSLMTDACKRSPTLPLRPLSILYLTGRPPVCRDFEMALFNFQCLSQHLHLCKLVLLLCHLHRSLRNRNLDFRLPIFDRSNYLQPSLRMPQ